MGADIKQIKNRIKSVDSTLHITKAMQLVAASKIKRAADEMSGASDYVRIMSEALPDLICRETQSSCFINPPKTGVSCFVMICGDRGLAGGYNNAVTRLLIENISPSSVVLPIGKRAVEYCQRHGLNIVSDIYTSSEKITSSDFCDIASLLTKEYKAGKFDSLYVIHTVYKNVITTQAEITQIFPIKQPEKKNNGFILFEPSANAVLEAAIPNYLTAVISSSVRESFLCELYSRRNAMDSASKNAGDMIEHLNLVYNRARQSTITQEITEIVAGAELNS